MTDPYAEAAASEARFYAWCADHGVHRADADAALARAVRALRYETLPEDAPRDPHVLARQWLTEQRWPTGAEVAEHTEP